MLEILVLLKFNNIRILRRFNLRFDKSDSVTIADGTEVSK